MAGMRIIWIGKTKERFVSDGIEFYRKRLAPFHPVELVEVRAAAHSGRTRQEALRQEAEAVLKRAGRDAFVVLLDEKGEQLGTTGLAAKMRSLLFDHGNAVTFVVGGAYGVDGELRERADWVLSLSRLTLPHQLVRVVLLEQLYRVASLNAGQQYHHE